MGRLEKVIITVIAAILVLLIALLAFQSFILSNETATYRISVLIENQDDDYWTPFQHGMNQAGVDYNVDVRFMSMSGERASNIAREIENGADAIVLSATPGNTTSDWLNTNTVDIPIITIGSELNCKNVTLHVGADEYILGQKVGIQVAESGNWDNDVVIFVSSNAVSRDPVYLGLVEYLEDNKIGYHTAIGPVSNYLTNMSFTDISPKLIVGLERQIIEDLCDFAETNDKNYNVIGVDYTNKLLHYIENGLILSLVIQSKYDLGYISVEMAVAAARGERPGDYELDIFIATKDNMYSTLAPILFSVY